MKQTNSWVKTILTCTAISISLLSPPLSNAASHTTNELGVPEQKPAAPVQIKLSTEGSLVSGTPFTLHANVTPLVDASAVSMQFRPATSLTADGATTVQLGKLKAGASGMATLKLNPTAGGDMRVGAVVLIQTQDGKTQARATVLTVHVKGTEAVSTNKPAGEFKERSDGRRVVVLQ